MSNYFDLGTYTRPITTASKQAQLWFDRGLIWTYAYNHEEAVACFCKTIEIDPECAMGYWGIAYASGPFYNMPWEMFSAQEAEEAVPFCYGAVQQATQRRHQASPVEQALITALSRRYQTDHVVSMREFDAWDDAYANAMREVYNAFPQDLDVIALFAEGMMTRTPWKLWDPQTGEPATGADTVESIDVLEKGLALSKQKAPGHPGILHMYLHALEMSRTPERALKCADALRDISPEAGHLQHMPSHIYVLCGLYEEALAVSDKAIAVDYKYLDYAGPYNFYTTARCHDLHQKMYAAMLSGRFTPALRAADGIVDAIPIDVLHMNKPYMTDTLEGYYSTHMHVLIRFGKWREIVNMPSPEDVNVYRVTAAMDHYAKGVAHAALGNIEDAKQERTLFEKACAAVPSARYFFNNTAVDILAVGAEMLNGELEYRKRNYDGAFHHLRRAVELEDALHYTEPRAWMHPPRHALGALLLEQELTVEAEQVYRADLGLDDSVNRFAQHPDNIWSLHGYAECLRSLNRKNELLFTQQRLDLSRARCDIRVDASCACRTSKWHDSVTS